MRGVSGAFGATRSISETRKLVLCGRLERGTTQLDCDKVPTCQSLSVPDFSLPANDILKSSIRALGTASV